MKTRAANWPAPALLAPLAGLLVLWVVLPIQSAAGLPSAPALCGLAALLAAAPLVMRPDRGHGARELWIEAIGIVLFLLGAWVSVAHQEFAPDPGAFRQRVATYVAYAGLYVALALQLRGPNGEQLGTLLRRALFCAVAAHALYAYCAYFAGHEPRLSGVAFNPNFFASVLTASWLFFECTDGRAAGRRTRVLLGVIVGITVLLTGSRAGTALFALACVLVVPAKHTATRRAAWRALLLVGVVTAAVLLTDNPLSRRIATRSGDRTYPRTFVWEVAAKNLLDDPLGFGPGMNRLAFARRAEYPADPPLLHRRHEIGLAHNVLLGTGVELGVLGLLGFLTFAAAPLVRQYRARRGPDSRRARGAFYALLVLLLHAQVDGLMQSPLVVSVFLFLVAEHGAALAAATRREDAPRPAPPAPRRALAVLPACAAVAALAVGLRVLHCAVEVRRGDACRAQGDLGAALVHYGEAIRRDPHESAPRIGVVDCLAQRVTETGEPAVLRALGAAVEQAARLVPQDPRPWLALGAAAVRTGYPHGTSDPTLLIAALGAFHNVLERDPLDIDARYRLAALANLLGDRDRARDEFEEVLRLEPNHLVARAGLADVLEREGDVAGAIAEYRRALASYDDCEAIARDRRYGSRAFYADLVAKFDRSAVQMRITWLQSGQP